MNQRLCILIMCQFLNLSRYSFQANSATNTFLNKFMNRFSYVDMRDNYIYIHKLYSLSLNVMKYRAYNEMNYIFKMIEKEEKKNKDLLINKNELDLIK